MSAQNWLQPKQAIEMLVEVGAERPEAWHIVAQAMGAGGLRCFAATLTTRFVGGPDHYVADAELPCDAWVFGGVPSPGHTFWNTGDVNLTVRLPGSEASQRYGDDEHSLAPVAPETEVRGARLDRAGVELLVFEYKARIRSDGPKKKKSGSADLLPSDDEIEAMMMTLIARGLTRDKAAKRIRDQPGFGAVTNEHARRVVANKLPRGRPKK